jgi:hypothetical protein
MRMAAPTRTSRFIGFTGVAGPGMCAGQARALRGLHQAVERDVARGLVHRLNDIVMHAIDCEVTSQKVVDSPLFTNG